MKFSQKSCGEILSELSIIHHGEYKYEVLTHEIRGRDKIRIKCSMHGLFEQRADHHANGSRCPKCSGSFYKTTLEYIEEVKKVHGDRFILEKTKYVNSKTPVTMTCRVHGDFSVSPAVMLKRNSIGCMECLGRSVNDINTFVGKARRMHPEYNYSDSKYVNAKTALSIRCLSHGSFDVTPDSFFSIKTPCPRCRVAGSSFLEKEWLMSFCRDLLFQHKIKIGRKIYKVDGFDPKTNTVYEFYGDYYHGNDEFFDPLKFNPTSKISYGALYERTIDRERELRSAGYRIVSIWESDYYREMKIKAPYKSEGLQKRVVNRLNFLMQFISRDEIDSYDCYANLSNNEIQKEVICGSNGACEVK